MASTLLNIITACLLAAVADAARQAYDVHKIIDALRRPREDLVIICAHRAGMAQTKIVEMLTFEQQKPVSSASRQTNIHISADGQLTMIHDAGLGRVTDIGEQTGQAACNPFTGQGYNPSVNDLKFIEVIENLRLRDEGGRVRDETVPSLPGMVRSIYDSGANVSA